MPRIVASNKEPMSPTAGSSCGAGATTAVQASAATSAVTATLAPNDDEVNGASRERNQSIETLLMTTAWKTRPSAASSCPRHWSYRGSRTASADQPVSA